MSDWHIDGRDIFIQDWKNELKEMSVEQAQNILNQADKFMDWIEKWYSIMGKVKRSYSIEEDNELVEIYWEMKEPN